MLTREQISKAVNLYIEQRYNYIALNKEDPTKDLPPEEKARVVPTPLGGMLARAEVDEQIEEDDEEENVFYVHATTYLQTTTGNPIQRETVRYEVSEMCDTAYVEPCGKSYEGTYVYIG